MNSRRLRSVCFFCDFVCLVPSRAILAEELFHHLILAPPANADVFGGLLHTMIQWRFLVFFGLYQSSVEQGTVR